MKAKLKERINTLINTVNFDLNEYESAILNNEVYDDTSDRIVKLDRSGRIMALRSIRDFEHLVKELCKISNKL
jgi:hypothetical protein